MLWMVLLSWPCYESIEKATHAVLKGACLCTASARGHFKQQATLIHVTTYSKYDYVTDETMTHTHITFVTQNKPGSNHLNFGMLHRMSIYTTYKEVL